MRPGVICLTAIVLSLLPSTLVAQAPPDGYAPAIQKFRAGDTQGAAEDLKAVTEGAPEFAPGWLFLGRSLMALERVPEAREAYAHLRTLPGQEGSADYFDGLALASIGQMDQAFETLLRAKASGTVNMTNIGLAPQAAGLRMDRRYRSLFPTPEEYADPFVEDVEILRDWVGEEPGDQFGWVGRNIGDVDGDGIMDLVTSATTWGSNAQGRIYVFSGATGALLWTADGEEGDRLGTSVEAAGDVDADGIPDVVAGGPGGGRVKVYAGRTGEVLRTFVEDAATGHGGSVGDAGDLNGDGHADVVVGASAAHDGAGMARVYSGADGSVLWEKIGEAGHALGSAVGGWGFQGGQLFLVGAPGAGPNQTGTTYAFKDLSAEPAFTIEADDGGGQNGAMFVSVLGDVDGDGLPDAYSSDFADSGGLGRVYVHSGATGERLYALSGENPGEALGTSMSDAGDLDGDGHADLAVGAWQYGGEAVSGGRIYVYSGATGELAYTITGKVPGETLGFDSTGMGDVNGDGIGDLLVTSAWSGINGTRSGRMLLVAGKSMR